MLHNLLSQYLEDVETAILDLKRAYIEHYSEEILTHNRINLRIRVHKHLPDKVVSAKKISIIKAIEEANNSCLL